MTYATESQEILEGNLNTQVSNARALREQTYTLSKDEPSSISNFFLSRFWDELLGIRKKLHNPKHQFDQNWEVFFKLRSLIQMLPQNVKEKLRVSVNTFPVLTKEESEKLVKEIELEIGSRPIVTVGGFPFGEDDIQRKERVYELKAIAFEKKLEEIIGNVASTLRARLLARYCRRLH